MSLARTVLLGSLFAFSVSAHADGSGTLSDTGLKVSYEGGGPSVLPNPFVLVDGSAPPPTCTEGTPTCDTYTLTVDLSDTFRDDPANAKLQVTFNLSFDGDWDMWMLDGSDAVIGTAAGTDNPEVIRFGLKQLPNGVYKFQMTPFFPETSGFVLTADASGSKSAGVSKEGSGALAGSFGFAALLGLFALAAIRRR